MNVVDRRLSITMLSIGERTMTGDDRRLTRDIITGSRSCSRPSPHRHRDVYIVNTTMLMLLSVDIVNAYVSLGGSVP